MIVNVMRGGPGLGNIGPEQADIKLLCRGLGHGNTHAIVLAPATPQEMLDFTQLAFELAFKYRNPVMIAADGYLGQMTGKVTLPDGHGRSPACRPGRSTATPPTAATSSPPSTSPRPTSRPTTATCRPSTAR